MTTKLAYVCDRCGRECFSLRPGRPTFVYCSRCDLAYPFASWSYREPIIAAGLEALYRQICEQQLRAGMRLDSKSEFLKRPGGLFVTPPAILTLIATGIEFHAAPQVAPPAPPGLRLVH